MIIAHYVGYSILILILLGSSSKYDSWVQYGFGFSHCINSDMFVCSGGGIALIFKTLNKTFIKWHLSILYCHSSSDVALLTLIGHEIRKSPIVSASGLTVLYIYNQFYVAKFESQYNSFTYNSKTVS